MTDIDADLDTGRRAGGGTGECGNQALGAGSARLRRVDDTYLDLCSGVR
ncbi:hypothetical protein ACIA78_39110 [Streptomyces xanthochromogenes]